MCTVAGSHRSWGAVAMMRVHKALPPSALETPRELHRNLDQPDTRALHVCTPSVSQGGAERGSSITRMAAQPGACLCCCLLSICSLAFLRPASRPAPRAISSSGVMQASLLSSRQLIAQRPFTAALPARRPALRPLALPAQAKLSKASEFRGLTNEEIVSQVEEAKKNLFQLRIYFAKRSEASRGGGGAAGLCGCRRLQGGGGVGAHACWGARRLCANTAAPGAAVQEYKSSEVKKLKRKVRTGRGGCSGRCSVRAAPGGCTAHCAYGQGLAQGCWELVLCCAMERVHSSCSTGVGQEGACWQRA